MEKIMSKKHFGSRFIAFFVMLAMMASMCVPVAWADSAISGGNVKIYSDDNTILTEVDTGVRFNIKPTITYSNAEEYTTTEIHIYLGIDDINKIKILKDDETEGSTDDAVDEVGEYYTDGGYTYTLCKNNNGYYISVIGPTSGGGRTHTIPMMFTNGTVLDGDVLNVSVRDANGNDIDETSIKAVADLEWANKKTVSPTTYTVAQDATTLGTNLTYTITEASKNSINDDGTIDSTVTLADGEAVLQEYTITDTFVLPEGMYIALGNYATAADAVKAMLSTQNVPEDYTITAVADSNGKITSFTMTWKETNPAATDSSYAKTAMNPKQYTVEMNGTYIKIDESYTTNAISNTVKTDYSMAVATETGYELKHSETAESSAYTSVPVDGSGLGYVSKSLTAVEGKKANLWGDWFSGYVVAGDKLTYTIYVENNSESEKTYTVTDFLSSANLTFESCECSNGTILGTNTEDGNASFSVKISGKTTAAITIVATVNGDKEGAISNSAKVTLGEVDPVEVSTPEIPQKTKTPEISIQKWADITYFTDTSTFNYYIKVSNNGTAGAENIKIEDILPDGIALNGTATATSGTATVIGKTISDTVTLGAGESVQITIPVKIDSDAAAELLNITNTASESYSNKTSSNTITRNTASATGLMVAKQADKTIVSQGDTVTYTVTVTNPDGSGDLNGATVVVTDILPDGFTYVSDTASSIKNEPEWAGAYLKEGGSVTVDPTTNSAQPTFTFKNITIKNGNSFTFTITCTVDELKVAAGETITNTVQISDGEGNTGNSGSSDIKASGTASDSKILIEKTAEVNGENIDGGAVAPGETITYYLKVTNNGTEDLKSFTITDTLEGEYDTSSSISLKIADKSDGVTYYQNAWNTSFGTFEKDTDLSEVSTGSLIISNNTFVMVYAEYDNHRCNGNYFYSGGLTIPENGWITFSYTLTTAAAFAGGSNEVTMTAGTEMSNDKVTYGSSGVESGEEPEEPEVPKAQLEITKSVENEVLTTDQLTTRNKYTVTVTNTSEEDYVTTDAVFTDYIPGNMALSIDPNTNQNTSSSMPYDNNLIIKIIGKTVNEWNISSDVYYSTSDVQTDSTLQTELSVKLNGESQYTTISAQPFATLEKFNPQAWVTQYGYTWFDENLASDKVNASEINVSFNDTLTIPSGQSLTFTYYLIPTDEEVASITNAVSEGTFEDREYKNEAAFSGATAFLNSEGATVNKIIDVETVTMTVPDIHPGISKEYTYHFSSAADSLHAAGTLVMPTEYFVWTIKVYNNNVAGGLAIKDYTVTDTYPEGHTYVTGSLGEYKPEIYMYDVYGNKTALDTYVEPDNGKFTFSGDTYAIPKGGHLEFTVLTKGGANLAYGLYTNTARLDTSTTQPINKETVIAGTYIDGGIEASATIPIYSISTDSKKYVTSSNVTVDSTADALGNRVKASMGETVRYKLEVTNNDLYNRLLDFSIIDRLPYTDDKAVVATTARGSAFPIKYAGNVAVTITFNNNNESITLDENYVDIKFASDAYTSFESTDLDWLSSATARAGITRVAWGDTQSDSTNLVKFSLVNLDALNDTRFAQDVKIEGEPYTKYGVPADATITIEFDGKIPEYVQNVGENNIAWNSFGYYFNSETEENLIAEPAKVGVWVEDENYGGSILVKKIYKTNLPSKVRTFYFALYEGEYNAETNNKPLDITNITMTGSENGAQATTYFTNIDFDRSKNNAYYIYESDANGVPLEAYEMEDGSYTATKPNSGSDTTEKTQTKANYKSKTAIGADGLRIVMDNTAQNKSAEDKPNWYQYDNEVEHYNSNYLVWHKDLSASKTTNSAIFTNTYIASAKYEMMGPFYADVPTSKTDGATEKMTSTRPTEFTTEEITNVEKSTERTMSYGAGPYAATNRYGDGQKHTIATGFLARLTGEGNYTIEQVQWTVTTSDANARSTEGNPGVYVRLRTTESYDTENSSVETHMYLNDFDVYEESTNETLELGTVGGFDDVTEDEDFLSDYTVEERAAMIAEGLGIDPDNILYDDFGQPYVVLDEELEAEAFALSESTETTTPVTTNKSEAWYGESSASYLEEAREFTDYNSTTGYIIYKLVDNAPQYTMTFNDNIPHITITEGAQAYVGLVIDQLYDQKATAKLKLSDEPLYDDTMLVATSKANMANYTLVESPRQNGNFSISVLYKMSVGNVTTFEDLLASDGNTQKYTSTIYNTNNTARITANSSKSVSVQKGDNGMTFGWSNDSIVNDVTYTGYLALGGSGSRDYRSLIVNVPADCTLRFIAQSSGTSERTLKVDQNVVQEDGSVKSDVTKVTVPAYNNMMAESFAGQQVYIKDGGAVYLYSAGSGINIFAVEIVSGDETLN